jgi:DNA-binding transcriptional MerR regulator
MQQNHLDSLNALEPLMMGLISAPAKESFSGPAADEALQTLEEYLRTERTLSSAVGVLEEVSTTTTTCLAEVDTAVETLAAAAEDEAILLEVTAAVDVASVAQAGLDPVTDIPGIVLTVIAGAAIIGALVTFGLAIYHAVKAWQHTMDQAGGKPQPRLPYLGSPGHGPQNSLSATQEDVAQRLYKEFSHLGLSLDDIRKIIEENPGLTEDQLRELLSQYGKVIAANPNLVKQYGVLAVFQQFIALAAYDAAHGGNYSLRQPVVNMPNLQAGIEEAMAEMGVMEGGQVEWPLTPSSTDPSYDVADPSGQKWDEKSYRSIDSNGNTYDPQKTVQDLRRKDIRKGEKIIFDDSKLTQQEIDDTEQELKNNGLDKDVIWWPTKPSQLQSTPTPTSSPTVMSTPTP